jgi:3-oxoacyl-[acyl-carrier protein] reductase
MCRSACVFGGKVISLTGKAALVTGGSRGIGAATVKLFAQAGADVVFGYHRNRKAAQEVEQEARKHGTRIESFQADLRKMDGAKKLVEFATQRLGRIDILIANAGIYSSSGAPIQSMTEKEWDEMCASI